jgi:hypothetical protein
MAYNNQNESPHLCDIGIEILTLDALFWLLPESLVKIKTGFKKK